MNSVDYIDMVFFPDINECMYIRDAYKKKGDKKYSCLVLVETVITQKGPRQKIILTLGNVNVPKERWPILAEMIRRRLTGQGGDVQGRARRTPGGYGVDRRAAPAKGEAQGRGRKRPEEVIKTQVNELKVEEPRMLGPVLVAEEYWKRLGMTEVLKECELSKKEIERARVEVLREKEKGLFRLEEKIYLYDLTGSYFEGGSEGNRSEERRV